jgi:hypothetical protein
VAAGSNTSRGGRSSAQRLQEHIDNGAPCYVCQQSLGSQASALTLQLSVTQPAHKACYNGAHALQRIVQGLASSLPQAR